MKLLLDQNLSPRLIGALSDLYPRSTHARAEGMATATDQEIWEFAAAGGYTIVSKDSDFNEMLVMQGAPPKVIWIRTGNCTTDAIADLLRSNAQAIEDFGDDDEVGLLELQ